MSNEPKDYMAGVMFCALGFYILVCTIAMAVLTWIMIDRFIL